MLKNLIIQSKEEKKNGQITRRISRRRMVLNPMIKKSSSICIPNMRIQVCIVAYEKCHFSKYGWKKNGQIQGRISRRRLFPSPIYNKSSSTCILNMRILACMVVEKSLTKYFIPQSMKGKKI